MNRATKACLCVVGLAMLGSCGDAAPRTGVLLLIETDDMVRPQIANLEVRGYGGLAGAEPGDMSPTTVDDLVPPITFPVRVFLEPREGNSGSFRVQVEARDAMGSTVAQTQIRSDYITGQVRYVRVRLYATCAAGCTTPDRACGNAGMCVAAFLPPTDLCTGEIGCPEFPPPVTPMSEICDNGRDDDGDGLSDCADSDCAGHPSCSTECAIPCLTEIDCADGAFCDSIGGGCCREFDCVTGTGDEDGDGRPNCMDPDCNDGDFAPPGGAYCGPRGGFDAYCTAGECVADNQCQGELNGTECEVEGDPDSRCAEERCEACFFNCVPGCEGLECDPESTRTDNPGCAPCPPDMPGCRVRFCAAPM